MSPPWICHSVFVKIVITNSLVEVSLVCLYISVLCWYGSCFKTPPFPVISRLMSMWQQPYGFPETSQPTPDSRHINTRSMEYMTRNPKKRYLLEHKHTWRSYASKYLCDLLIALDNTHVEFSFIQINCDAICVSCRTYLPRWCIHCLLLLVEDLMRNITFGQGVLLFYN